MVCYRVVVSGRVQGVFYRASTKTKADSLGLNGWVKNEKDGSVSIAIEGPEAKVSEMIDWCAKGPSHARVDNLEREEIAIENYPSFEIRY